MDSNTILFGFFYQFSSNRYIMNLRGRDYNIEKEFLADKWYKVYLLLFLLSKNVKMIFITYLIQTLKIKIDIIQSKRDNSCYAEVRWQNELVVEANYSCPIYDNDLNLYIAAYYYGRVIDGQVRNFSYVKK